MHELSGTVKVVFDEQTFASGFTKREFVVTDGSSDKYPQDIKLECVKDKCELVKALNVGDKVKVTFDLRGNEYNGRYFVNLAAWKIETLEAAQPAAATPPAMAPLDDDPLDDSPPF